MINEFLGVKGTIDIIPEDYYLFDYLNVKIKNQLIFYGYKLINIPILEYKNLFYKTLGIFSNILEKEIYAFNTNVNSKTICLRPENTTSVMRIYLKHNLKNTYFNKFCYISNTFRHDNPQKNRYREFCQIGLEILDQNDVIAELELIIFCNDIFTYLNIRKYLVLNINSIGLYKDIFLYKIELIKFILKNINYFIFDKNYLYKIYKNVLNILDIKIIKFVNLIKFSPKIFNYLNLKSFKKFEKIKFLLKKCNITFFINKNLIRGLDYYNDFVFEWIDKVYNFNSLVGGGRYDFLSTKFMSKKLYSCGLSIGFERILEIFKKNKIYTLVEFDLIFIYFIKCDFLKIFFLFKALTSVGLKCFITKHFLNNDFNYKLIDFTRFNSKFFIIYNKNIKNILKLIYIEKFFNKKIYKYIFKNWNILNIKKFFLYYKGKIC